MSHESENASEYAIALLAVEAKYTEPCFDRDPLSFELLSTIRYDPTLTNPAPALIDQITPSNYYLLDLHLQRLRFALSYFTIHYGRICDFLLPSELVVQKLDEAIATSQKKVSSPFKMRLLLKLDGTVVVEVHDTPAVDNLESAAAFETEPTYDLYIAKIPTPISPFTSFKTTVSQHYNDARKRSLPERRPGNEEVLLYNFQGILTEGSITNVAVRHGDQWITPMLSSGCLCGVMRHNLLQKGLIVELTIDIHQVSAGSEILVFNAIIGVARGILIK